MSRRRSDVDVVRFLALVSMYVAHVAPAPGPARVLELSEYLTMPLFALLVGAGSQLGVRSAGTLGWWWSVLVRATVLVGLGLVLDRAGAQVVIVLVHLGVLVVVAALLARLSTVVVAVVALASLVVAELLRGVAPGAWIGADPVAADLARLVWVDGPYRLLPMVVYAAAGIVLSRWWLQGAQARSVLVPGVTGCGLLVVAAAMLGAEQGGRIDLVPYSGTVQETVLDALLAAGVLGVGLALARLAVQRPTGRRAADLVAAAGAMSLTLYALQVLWLAYDVRRLHPGQRDDSWANLAVLLCGSLVLVAAWRAVVRPDPWRRGPLEGVVDAVAHGPSPRRGAASRPKAGRR